MVQVVAALWADVDVVSIECGPVQKRLLSCCSLDAVTRASHICRYFYADSFPSTFNAKTVEVSSSLGGPHLQKKRLSQDIWRKGKSYLDGT